MNASRQQVLTQSLLGSNSPRPATQAEKAKAAKAWAEFLLEEFKREKALRNSGASEIIEVPTYHDKLND